MQYEPNVFQVETVTVSFFSGRYDSGALVGSITRQVDGDGGARLFAWRAEPGFRSVVITNKSDAAFAITQIRVRLLAGVVTLVVTAWRLRPGTESHERPNSSE